MGLKNLYYAMEDKWYKFWDKIDSKIPVYGIIDRVDSVIPSLMLFLLIIVFVILFFGATFYFSQTDYTATFNIYSATGTSINDSRIGITLLGEDGSTINTLNKFTNSSGVLVLDGLMQGQQVQLDIDLSKGTFSGTFNVTGDIEEDVVLRESISLEPIKRNIYLKNEHGLNVTDPVAINFSCQNSSVIPNPSNTTVNGSITITEPLNCIRLIAGINSNEYQNKTYEITTSSFDIILERYEPASSTIKVRMKYNNLPANGSFNVNLSGRQDYSVITNNSEAVFEVLPGTYFLSVSSNSAAYGTISKTITVDGDAVEDVELTKNVVGRIGVIVRDETTNALLEGAIVTLKNASERGIATSNTGANGEVVFAIVDSGKYFVNAKLPGDLDSGYFSKTIELESVTSDVNIVLELERITITNAGKVVVSVTDQDGEAVSNAKVMLKYDGRDTLVELNDSKNYGITDINGSVVLLAGQVTGKVYASAIKYPFSGVSNAKNVALQNETTFDVEMFVGNTTVQINAENEIGEKVNGEARLFDGDGSDASDLISIENGIGQITIKAGKTVYLAVTSDLEENYYSEVRFLWPETTESFDVKMLSEINEPAIAMEIYNEGGSLVNSLQQGNDYYALFTIDSDQSYNEVITHFRTGTEELMENDYLEIDSVEGAGINSEIRGQSYSPTRGYAFDSENLTGSLAKWVTLKWNNFGIGRRKIRINFRVKTTTPTNEALRFFWRAAFEDNKKPSSNSVEELYDDTYSSDPYFVGEEAVCDTPFCTVAKWMYDNTEELYVGSPYQLEQAKQYTYHFQIINNSLINYGSDGKEINLNLEMLSEDGLGAKIISYQIREPGNEVSGGSISAIRNLDISSFERRTAIDVTLTLEGNLTGTSYLKSELKSDGEIVFSSEEPFSVPSAEELFVSLDKTFIPTLINTDIVVEVRDNEGEPLVDSTVRTMVKEPGFSEFESDVDYTNRLGKVTIGTGAHFPGTKVIIEVSKAGYAKKRLSLTVSDNIIAFNPSTVNIQLNTISKREETTSIAVANATGKELEIISINLDSEMGDTVNEGALRSYLNTFIGEKISREGTSTLDLMRVRVANSLTPETYIEPISETGRIIMSFGVEDSSIVFDNALPFNINISSSASTEATCLLVSNAVQTKATQRGQVQFVFEILNACESEEGVGVAIEELVAYSTQPVDGMAELSLQSVSSSMGGRTALDGGKRKVYDRFRAGEKLMGTVTFVPNTSLVGTTVNIPVKIEGKFLGTTIVTNPSQLDFSVNVINLKECMQINSSSGIVANDEMSEVSIDATNCLDQQIEVFLCRNDAGCSGGTEGKINLNLRQFMLQQNSQTVQASSPTLPGTYGVSVWARIRNMGSYNYIGEVPVSFRETSGKFFSLNKFEVNVVGEENEDIIQLTNNMLSQNIKVKADNCIWGVKDPETNWATVMGGAMLGAQLGSMMGGALESAFGDFVGSALSWTGDKIGGLFTSDDPDAYGTHDTIIYPDSTNPSNSTSTDTSGLDTALTDASDRIFTMDGATHDPLDVYTLPDGSITSSPTKPLGGELIGNVTPYTMGGGQGTGYNWNILGTRGTSTSIPGVNANITHLVNTTPSAARGLLNWNTRGTPPLTTSTSTTANQSANGILPKASFASFSGPVNKISFGATQGLTTILGAVGGGLAAYFSQDTDCSDTTQIVSYQDFVVLLQGTTLGVSGAGNNTTTSQRTIPSDAGEINFSLGGIGTNWDFSNADYSSVEHVGLKFTNNGLNEPRAKYGVLTIGATTHNHGNQLLVPNNVTLSNTTTPNASDHDITCTQNTFGRYWIGDDANSGKCTGISTGTYSQKYHIRVLSGEAEEQEAYIRSAQSCYNGVLTGSTGADAVPRVSLEWDWEDIDADTCDYGNSDYAYCDATQFTITLVKKMTALNEFFKVNSNIACPENPGIQQALEQMDQLNSVTELVADRFIGITEINVSMIGDQATASVIIQNNTGGATTSYVSALWRGYGSPVNDSIQQSFPEGESIIYFTATLPEYDDLYFFVGKADGPSGNKRAVQRAFQHAPENTSCWITPTTRPQGGIPSVIYYLAGEDQTNWTNKITNPQDLQRYMRFRSYLMRDAYSEDFLNDFKQHYLNELLQIDDASEREMLEHLNTSNFNMVKRYSNQANVEAGLYDVYMYVDFGEDFTIVNDRSDTSVEASLLLIRNPSNTYPLYNLPFNGTVGGIDRQGYGVSILNETDGFALGLNDNTVMGDSINSNGVSEVRVTRDDSFERVNTNPGSRGQLASISVNGTTADIVFTPNYATPIIVKQDADGTNAKMAYHVERDFANVLTGGNLSYWTGAARSKDFYGANAIEMYRNSPDYLLETGDYGFEWEDITNNDTLYLKTTFFTPVTGAYAIIGESDTSFWTPNNNFTQINSLDGISGMANNSSGNHFETLEDLFSMVENGDVCVSNDGSTMSFWWNPHVLENTAGLQNSLAEKELELVGTQ